MLRFNYTEAHSVLASRLRENMNADTTEAAATEASTVGAEPKMRADARRSRARLIEAATAAFAENGADAPLDDIARRAGVGIGTLYRHFPTRTDLQSAVFRSQVVTVCSEAEGLRASWPPEQAFVAWLRVLARYLVTKRGLSRALVDSLGKDSELLSSCSLAMRETVERLLATGQEAGVLRPDLTATDVLRLVHGVAISTEQAPEDTDRLLSLLFDGMRCAPPGDRHL
jgi:AcrR family transcriptional regulator